MGCCFGRGGGSRVPTFGDSIENIDGLAVGGNKPLQRGVLVWANDAPINEAQLHQMREEFWDTAPSYEGRKEIWEALRGACEACEKGDHDLAQAILEGVGVTLPSGTLTQCYDELGNRYVVPKYCLAPPTNLISSEVTHTPIMDTPPAEDDSASETMLLKIRLSTMKDLKISVRPTALIRDVKSKLHQVEGIDPQCVKLLFSGRLLKDDQNLSDLDIPRGYVIQAVIAS